MMIILIIIIIILLINDTHFQNFKTDKIPNEFSWNFWVQFSNVLRSVVENL